MLRRCFSEGQRLALEHWILSQDQAKKQPVSWNRWQQLVIASGQPLRRGELATEAARWRAWNKQTHGPLWRQLNSPLSATRRIGQSQQYGSAGGGKNPEAVRPKHPVIRCRWSDAGRAAYSASGVAGPFQLFTRAESDMAVALRNSEVLAAIRQRLDSEHCEARLEDSFRCAVQEEPAKLGIDTEDLGLTFAGTVSAGYWVGRQLFTPRFPVSAVDAGLSAWRRLRNARGSVFLGPSNRYSILRRHSPLELELAWQHLRTEYLGIWAEAGKDRGRVAAHLDVLQHRHVSYRLRRAVRWSCVSVPAKKRPALEAFGNDASCKATNGAASSSCSSASTDAMINLDVEWPLSCCPRVLENAGCGDIVPAGDSAHSSGGSQRKPSKHIVRSVERQIRGLLTRWHHSARLQLA